VERLYCRIDAVAGAVRSGSKEKIVEDGRGEG
jgi:hypothetical protein